MKKIFITGISGLLGSNLAFFLRKDFDVSGLDLLPIFMKDVDALPGDVLNKQKTEEVIARIKPDIIVHCIASVNVDRCEEDLDMATRINTTTTQIMSDIAKNVNAKFIYISTDSVFDGTGEGLYTESDAAAPPNNYAKTKADGEKITLLNNSSLVLRTNIYGYNYREQISFGEWIQNALINEETLNLFTDVFFSPILVNDMVDVIKISVDLDLCGLYHACAKGSISKHDFGCKLKSIFGINTGQIIPISVDDFEFKAKRAKNMGMDSQKFTKDSGYVFRTPEESILEFYELWKWGYPQVLKGVWKK